MRNALALSGLAYSLGTAPSEAIRPDLPQIDLRGLHEKVYWLGQAGRHVKLGEDLFDSAAVLAAEWTGARNPDWEWDRLRRITQKGGLVGDSLAQVFAAEATATSPSAAFDRFASTTAYLGPLQAALGVGPGVSVTVASRTSGKTVVGSGIDPLRVRELAFADLYDLGGSQMALMASPEEGGYRIRLEDADGGGQELHLLIRDEAGVLRKVEWNGLSLAPGGSAEVEYQPTDGQLALAVDADGDGQAESLVPGLESTFAPRPFSVLSAVQDPTDHAGHSIEVLFSQDVDLQSLYPRDPNHFSLPGNVSNGGLVQVEADLAGGLLGGCSSAGCGDESNPYVIQNPFEGLLNTRVVRVLFNNPVSPYKTHELTVQGVASVTGETVSTVPVSVQTTVTDPGTIVQGRVFGPGGQPVPYAQVELVEADQLYTYFDSKCYRHPTALVQADAAGRFELDYVRQTACSDLYEIRGSDPASGRHGSARGRVRFIGQTVELDVLMLGRGTVRGRVTYEDGSVPESFQVVGYSPVFFEGSEAKLGPDGTYEIRDLPVGTISLGATDYEGGYVYQTVEIPSAGSVTERNLTIIRRSPEEATGDVRGTVFATDGTTPIFDAYVALYVDGELSGVERSGADGIFDFGTVPAGLAEIEAFDGATGLSGAQLFFEVQADQVNEVTVLLKDDRGAVEGHVYRQRLDSVTPVEGAVVWVSGTPFNTVTNADGFYRMEGVFAGSRQILAADLENQAEVRDSVTVQPGGQTAYRDLYFIESVGSGLAGEVLGVSGNPVPGATIHLGNNSGGWWKATFTDTSGRFTLPDLPPGSYEIYAYAGNVGIAQGATIHYEGETPFVRIQFKRGTIRGKTETINEQGQTVGVISLVTYRTTVVNPLYGIVGLDYRTHTLETNADGTFEIPDVLAGSYQLTVSNAFLGERTARGEIVTNGQVEEHDFLFEPSGRVHGTVLDWDGATPVAGVTVNLRHPAFGQYDLTTDAEGKFAFELIPPGSDRFAIDAEIERDGVYRSARIWAALTRAGQDLEVEITLPMQGAVSGWVADADGALVPNAVVTLREGVFPNRTLVHNTDADGNFSFTNVFAGPVSLSAQAPTLGGLGGRDQVEIVEEGQEVYSVITLESTGEVTGRVLSPETGEVVPTVQVAIDRRLGISSYDTIETLTTNEGEFRFRLLPLASYRVRAFDPSTGRVGQTDWADVSANGQVVDIPLTLEVRGIVEGHLYEPESLLGIPGATIALRTSSLRPFTTYASTDVDGHFDFAGIPEGAFTLTTRDPGGRRRASGSGEIVAEDQVVTVDLYLEAVGRVVGSVLAPVGQPDGLFANSDVVIYEGLTVVGATLDNPYAFDGVIAGRSLEIDAHENGGDHRGRAYGKLQPGEAEITIDVRMEPLGAAAVTVQDSQGNPVAGASVRLGNRSFYGWKSLSASTGPDGRAVFAGLGAGPVSVSAVQPVSQLRGSTDGQLTLDGEQLALVVQLQDSGVVQGRVLTSDGLTPAADALVVLTRGGRTLQLQADADGYFSFSSVPLGGYTVFVQQSFGPGTIQRSGSMASNGEVDDLGTLVLDDDDPAVVSIEPVSGSADVPLSSAVTVHFSEPVDVARWSGSWITFRKLASSGVGYTPAWSEGDTVLTLTPNAPLASFTGYEVLVKGGYDFAGRSLREIARTTFNTVDVVPPTVVDIVPRDGQSQVPVDASVLVTFSEQVTFDSLSGTAFQLTDLTGGSGVTTTFQQLAGERQVLLTPASGLQADHHYQLTIQAVRDHSGNAMSQPVTTTFWSVDTIAPQIVSIEFPAGSSFTSGDDVPVTVTATDDWGVASVGIAIQDWSWSDDAEPWELTGVAPIVAATSDLTVAISATDSHGNVATVERTIQVAPNPNLSAPEISASCGHEGGVVVPGIKTEFRYSIQDDEAIESVRFLVDSELIDGIDQLDVPRDERSFLWAPPAGATPGTSFTVRLEARDFAGNMGSRELSVSVPSGVIKLGGGSLFNDYAGQELTLAAGDFVLREPLDLSALHVVRGTTLILPSGSSQMVLQVQQGLDLQCGAAIDVTGDGYPGGTAASRTGGAPEWVSGPGGDLGGSHGGFGAPWSHPGAAGEVFDSIYEPTLPGGGGSYMGSSSSGVGAFGGGVLDIAAGSLVLEGDLRARGADAANCSPDSGSGAGGTVVVRANVISGGGQVDASGGTMFRSGSFCWNGSGGGGRVALLVDSFDGFDPVTQAKAWGGQYAASDGTPFGYAGPGTVYFRDGSATYGSLVVDPGLTATGEVRRGPSLDLPALGSGGIVSAEVAGPDLWITSETPMRARWLGAWMVLLDVGGSELGSFRVAEIGQDGRVRLEGAGSVTGASAFRGLYRFDRVVLPSGGSLGSSDKVEGSDWEIQGEASLSGRLEADNILVKRGAVVRPGPNGSLRFEVTDTLTVEAGAVIDVTGGGYPGGTAASRTGGAPEWVSGPGGDLGGSHGGFGAPWSHPGAAGEVFDSIYEPTLPGGGGSYMGSSSSGVGAFGGGVLDIAAGSLVLEGDLRARGADAANCSPDSGSGAGGTVVVRANVISGGGQVDASGGTMFRSGSFCWNGSGGGGRVALLVDSFDGFDPVTQAKAWGGQYAASDGTPFGYAGPGTVYFRDGSATYGSLVVDPGLTATGEVRRGPSLDLPALGSGGIVSAEVAGPDLWITSETPMRARWLGAWMVLLDVGGSELGSFRVAEIGQDGRVRLEGAGSVTGASAFRGRYQFDRVVLEQGATLQASDDIVGGTWTFDGDTTLSATVRGESAVITSGTVVQPPTGETLRFDLTGAMTIESGAVLDVTGLGYPGGTSAAPRGSAPDGVSGSTPTAGGSHGGAGGAGQNPGAVPGEVYDSVYSPQLEGGGGAGSGAAPGGGVVVIDAGSLELEGEIRALGGVVSAAWRGSGAGGAVMLRLGSLSGSGSVDVSGGDAVKGGRNDPEGAGGGGRVAVIAGTITGFDPATQIRAWGGLSMNGSAFVGYGAPGTVYLRTAASTFGDLYVDQGGDGTFPIPTTVLPPIGKGVVGSVTADGIDPTDVWVEDQDPAKLFSLGVTGMWVRVGGVDYPVIDQSADRRRLLLDGAAGAVAVGDAYVGVYKFDTVTVTGAAHLELRDADEVASFVVDPGSSVEHFDLNPPDVTVTSPAAGTLFTAGDPVAMAADASDDGEIASVTFHLGDRSFVDDTPPYEWTVPAPRVEAEQDVPIRVEALDDNDNLSSDTRTIRIRPNSDPLAPSVTIPDCPHEGDPIAAGAPLSLTFDASDNELLYRYALLVDGEVVDEERNVDQANASPTVTWTPPADALPGTYFSLEFLVEDYAGNVATESRSQQVIGATLLGEGQILDDSYDGQQLILGPGSYTVPGAVSLAQLTVLYGAEVRPAAELEDLHLSVAGTLTVECGGLLDATGYGYEGGNGSHEAGLAPEGISGSGHDEGGSHGGMGDQGPDRSPPGPGEVFDSVYVPSLGGGGGGRTNSYSFGGSGGGVIRIEAGSVDLEGEIRSRGENPHADYAGAGAGGTVTITASSLSGGGRIDASGGDYVRTGEPWSPPGGGGRIALYVEDLSGFDEATQILSRGGSRYGTTGAVEATAAAGTIYLVESGSTYGRLRVDGGQPTEVPTTDLPELGSGAVAAWEAAGSDAWLTGEAAFRERHVGSWTRVRDAAGADLGSYRILEVDASGRALLAGAAGVSGAAAYAGEYRFDEILMAGGAALNTIDPLDGGALNLEGAVGLPTELTGTSLTIRSGALVRPAAGGEVSISMTGVVTIEAGAVLDATGYGYEGGNGSHEAGLAPEGIAGSGHDEGGSHGGMGGQGPDTSPPGPGEVFDSVYVPSLGGGGGGRTNSYSFGGSGGGVIRIEAGSVDLEGEIRSRGENPHADYAGAGAGGTVTITASSLSGGGRIDASGGGYVRTGEPWSPPGGGGRVALYVDDLSGFDEATQVLSRGGSRYGTTGEVEATAAAGTIYVVESGSTYGCLRVDGGQPTAVPTTDLPELGSGAVAAWEATGSNAWLTGEAAFRERHVGSWMRIRDAAGADLGSYRVLEVDGSGRALLAGAAGVSGAAAYAGEYRFDEILIAGGAALNTIDPLDGGALDLEGAVGLPTELTGTSLTIRSGALVRPAAGGEVSISMTGVVTIEAGAVLDATGYGYEGGNGSHEAGLAPEGIAGSGHDEGGSHGGMGGQGPDTSPPGPGEVFDSVYVPSLGGGGGGRANSTYWGGSGGGVIHIDAGSVMLDGEIRARGEDPHREYAGAGAGGTVTVTAASLSGGGRIDASGGDYVRTGSPWSPPGGGGRVALYVDDLSGFDEATQVLARGGSLFGSTGAVEATAAAGTIFTRPLASIFGGLRVDQGGDGSISPPTTVLPSIGKGVIGTVTTDTADPTDTWIEDQDPAKLYGLGVIGMWVRVNGVDYPVVAQSADRRQLLLDGPAGGVSVGDAYVGVYKFDTVTVSGNSHLQIDDGDEVGSWVIDPGSSVVRLDLDPPEVTVTSPAGGTLFTAGDPVAIAADVTDPSGVVSVTFRLGDQSFVDDTAPYEWTVPAPVVEVEQDVPILIETLDGNGNAGSITQTIRVRPVAPGDPPVVSVLSPSPGLRLAPGMGMDFSVQASQDEGIDRVELLVNGDPTVVAIDFDAPHEFHFDVPAAAVDGDSYVLHFRARSLGGVYGEATYLVQVIAANVVTADTTIASTDTSLDGTSVVVAAGTLTVEGPHTFRDLVVLDGASVTHPATTAEQVNRLELNLSRDLFVAPGGAIDADALGYQGGVAYHEAGIEPFYMADDFNDGDIAGWQAVDEGEEGGPSNWSVSGGALRQTTNIVSNLHTGFGTNLVWAGGLPNGDFRVSAFLRSTDDDWLGLLFRYVDAGDTYRFVWARQSGFRLLEKVTGGVRTTLAQDTVVYATNTWYQVEIVAQGSRLQVWIDGQLIFDVSDTSLATGTIGVFCAANAGSYFEDVVARPLDGPSVFPGGSHGGRGGASDGSNLVYGNLFNPKDPGAGGGGISAAVGGGVVGIAAAGQVVVDGSVSARGAISPSLRSSSAGGSIRLDGTSIGGLGSLDASGGDGHSLPAAGGGGRIALYGGSIDPALVDRTLAAGGDADTSTRRGAAGTIYVKQDADPLGTLILDNGGLVSDQPTVLLPVLPGVVDSVTATSLTDAAADFLHDLAGIEVFFNGDTSALWTVTGNALHGQTLDLATSGQPLTAGPGDTYEGLYRFDRVIVRGGAEGVTRNPVSSTAPPEVEAGASWTAAYQPTITITNPTAGQSFAGGSTLTVTATVDDAYGVSDLHLTLDGQEIVDSSPPYSWSITVPPVTAPGDHEIRVTVVDHSGYEVESTTTVEYTPNPDPTAPSVTIPDCPRDGDLIAAGAPLDLAFRVADNELLFRYAFLVDGQVVDELLDVDQPTVSPTVTWTPPAGTPPGTQFSLQFQAEDYAGNVTTQALALSSPGGTLLAGGQTLDSSFDGQDIVLGSGTFTASESLSPTSLTLLNGAKLVAGTAQVRLAVNDVLRLQCGGALDVSAQGYVGGYGGLPDGQAPEWVTPSVPDAGGSHGGAGSEHDSTGSAGEVYDSVYEPALAGGGGALRNTTDGNQVSGAGGGVVWVTAGSAVVDGEVLARGETRGSYQSGGAGGSVLLRVSGSLSGVGRIDASGGDSWTNTGYGIEGSGGGGRVALYVGSLAGFDPGTQVQVQGGRSYYGYTTYVYGAPGTVLAFTGGVSTYGDLIVDAGAETDGTERVGPATELPELGSGAVAGFEIAGADAWVSGASALAPRWTGAWMALEDGSGSDLGTFQVAAVDETGRALLEGAGSVGSPSSYRGEYRFDGVTLSHGAGLVASDRLQAESVRAEGKRGCRRRST